MHLKREASGSFLFGFVKGLTLDGPREHSPSFAIQVTKAKAVLPAIYPGFLDHQALKGSQESQVRHCSARGGPAFLVFIS